MTDIPTKDGIYFGLDEDTYRAIERLSGSGIKTVGISPLAYWLESHMNPKRREEVVTPARKLGKAYHKLILEGDEAFAACYAVAPSKDDYPDALVTSEDIKAALDAIGLPKTGAKPVLIARLRDADSVVEIWDEIAAEAKESVGDRITLTKSQWEEIQQVRYVLQNMPGISEAFTDGHSEVSILWTDQLTGVPMKGRLDYLKRRGKMAGILDVKSFGNIMQKPIESIAGEEIGRNGYFVQPVAYIDAMKALRKLWADHGPAIVTVVSGPEPAPDWLDDVLTANKVQFHFVFVQSGGIPNVVVAEFAEGQSFGGQGFMAFEYWRKGWAMYRRGLQLYRDCLKRYGTDTPWIVDYGIRLLQDEDFKPWALEYNPDLPEDDVP